MLKSERLGTGMSQEKLMLASGVRQIEISRWENAVRGIPSAETIAKIEEGLGIKDGRLALSGGRIYADQIIEIEDDEDDPDATPIIHGMSRAA